MIIPLPYKNGIYVLDMWYGTLLFVALCDSNLDLKMSFLSKNEFSRHIFGNENNKNTYMGPFLLRNITF